MDLNSIIQNAVKNVQGIFSQHANTAKQYSPSKPTPAPLSDQYMQSKGMTKQADGSWKGSFGTPTKPTQQPTQVPQQQVQPQVKGVQGQVQPTDYAPNQNEQQIVQQFKQAGVPPALGLGIWAMEGHGNTINPNNPFNIGAIDSNPQNANAYQFKSPQEGIQEGISYLKGESQYQTAKVKQLFKNAYSRLQKTGDIQGYLQTVGPTYSSNPQWATTITQTPQYQALVQQQKNAKSVGYNMMQ